ERHRQALARPLRMPDHAHAPIAAWARRLDRRIDRARDGVELVIPGHLLGDRVTVTLEDDEVAQEVEQPALVEYAADQHLERAHRRGRERLALDGAPGHEALLGR